MSETEEENVIFVDETGFSVSMRTRRARSRPGTLAVSVVPGLRTKNISVCCAISKVECYIIGARSGVQHEFVRSFPSKSFCKAAGTKHEQCQHIMDNVAFQRTAVQEL